MRKVYLKKLRKGDLFRLKDSETAPLWVRDDYDRDINKYDCHKYDDVNHYNSFRGCRAVFVED